MHHIGKNTVWAFLILRKLVKKCPNRVSLLWQNGAQKKENIIPSEITRTRYEEAMYADGKSIGITMHFDLKQDAVDEIRSPSGKLPDTPIIVVPWNQDIPSDATGHVISESNYPPAEPGALFSVSRSKRLEGTLTRPRLIAPPDGGRSAPEVQLIQPLIFLFLALDVVPDRRFVSPAVETKYPRAQKCCPTKLRRLSP